MNLDLLPPGRAERVASESALVLAPHYDDEVLGCGGLVAQLTAGRAVVRVLFLTDGGGGGEEVADRDAYRLRRREEAACAARVLGVAGIGELGLPDGQLALRLGEAARGIRRALLTQRPDLVLAPSPLEVTADHRAAFAALHRVLAPLRDEELGALRVFLYEVNRPGFPDLLVDVSAEEERLAAAMACYASQQERHDYLGAALGIRRFRTHSLDPSVRLAEGYRRLALADFTTRSQTQLVAALGGVPELLAVREGPRLSVVVRTKDRPALLAEALASLAASTYRRAEVVLVNDGGAPPAPPAEFPLPIVRVDLEGNRGRAAAAEAGVAAAGGDFVTFLDDDDLASPEHLATLAGLASAPGVRVAYTDAAVGIYELEADGWRCRERRLPYSRDFDPDLLLLDNYIPFNTLAIERALFAEVGAFDRTLPFFEDWDFLIRLAERVPFHHLREVTCEYRHFRGGAHHVFGENPRERADFLAVKARVLGKHAARLTPERLARVVDTLRFERVAALERVDKLERELVATREALWARNGEVAAVREGYALLAAERSALAEHYHALEERYHALNGELQALKELQQQVTAEVHRLYEDEGKLRAVVDDQTAHLGRTYAEIERLNARLRTMEATRAWRLHEWWARRLS